MAGVFWQRKEVWNLWQELCTAAHVHEELSRELALAHEVRREQIASTRSNDDRDVSHLLQAVEGLVEIEARFEQLQMEARRSDNLGPALACISQFLRSSAKSPGTVAGDVICAEAASTAVQESRLPELQELWQEILLQSSQSQKCKDAVVQTASPSVRDMEGVVATLAVPASTDGAGNGSRMDAEMAACQHCSNDETDHSQNARLSDPCRDHLEALTRLEDMQEVLRQHEREAVEREERLAALELQLREIASALNSSGLESEVLREERDIVSDELAVLQARMIRIEEDNLVNHARAEEANLRNVTKISDLVNLIKREAPWLQHGGLEAAQITQDRSDGDVNTEALRSLVLMLLQEITNQTHEPGTLLDRNLFDELLAESMEIAAFLKNQGPSAGFVEADLREISVLETDLVEASARVDENVQRILSDWNRFQARECDLLQKRRQRSLQLLSMRLDGSTAPRHKLKALRSSICALLADGGKLNRSVSSASRVEVLHPSPTSWASSRNPKVSRGPAASSKDRRDVAPFRAVRKQNRSAAGSSLPVDTRQYKR